MSSEERDLMLVSATFPYGHGETFLESEILVLSKYFRKVYIVPLALKILGPMRVVPKNCEIVDVISRTRSSRFQNLLYLLGSVWFYNQLVKRVADFKNTFHSGLNISKQFFKLKGIVKDIDSPNLILYSYWFNLPSFALVQLKGSNNISKVITRAHRFDLYEEVSELGYHPFKKSFVSKFDKVVSISNDGLDYFQKKYSEVNRDKFVVSKLGVLKQVFKSYPPKDQKLLVSCSGIRPVKNVPTIAEMIRDVGNRNPGIQLKWFHFGNGDEEIIKAINNIMQSMPSNVSCELKGHITNSDLLEFYKKNDVYLFVNMSSSEGIPVSIMEAHSFGIPVLATLVGGVGEIIDDDNGFPVTEGEYQNYVDILSKAINLDKSDYLRKRELSFSTMQAHYNSEVNYLDFVNNVLLDA